MKIDGIEVNVDISMKNCECRDCYFKNITEIEKQNEHELIAPVWMLMQRVFLCEFCGNKRCPHATNHLNECINSNAVGQKGSAYE